MSTAPELVANYHCVTGENPLWDARSGVLHWVDIETARLFRFEPATGAHECFHRGPDKIGGFTLQEDGSLLLFEVDRIARLAPDGTRRVLAESLDSDMTRFNDVIADPEGRVFAGTIGKTEQSGGLYRVDLDGRVSVLWKGTGCANGMAFTPDLRGLYWTCSTTRVIYLADYDRDTGELSNRRPFYRAPESEGVPDGLTVDRAGDIWTARYGGGSMLRLDPRARLLEKLELPVSAVTSATFGGPELDTLFVTTAGGTGHPAGNEGSLFQLRTTNPGTAEFRSRVWL